MDLEIIILSEASQTEEHKYHVISPVCEILKKNDTNEFIYKTETDPRTLKTHLWLAKGKGGGRDKIYIVLS